jgi:hypothetical protein
MHQALRDARVRAATSTESALPLVASTTRDDTGRVQASAARGKPTHRVRVRTAPARLTAPCKEAVRPAAACGVQRRSDHFTSDELRRGMCDRRLVKPFRGGHMPLTHRVEAAQKKVTLAASAARIVSGD